MIQQALAVADDILSSLNAVIEVTAYANVSQTESEG